MFKVPASHRGFLIEPRPEYWRRIIEENRRLICGLRPWTLGSAHQSGLCHPGVLFKELLVAGATFRRKAHLNCDTAEVKKRYLEIPRDSGTVRLDYYSPKEANCYFRAEVPSEDKIKGFIQKAPGSEGRDFFKGLLLARRDSTNAGELNVKSKQNFFKKYHCHLPQLYLSRMLPGGDV